MKTIKILTLGALAASMSFAADAPSVTPVDQCRLALDNAKTNLPSNAYAAKLTLAEGYGTLNALETIYADDKNSKLIPTFLENCQKYAEIAKLQGETQAIQNHIAENWEKRAATNRTIEAIQEQIGEARSGKVSDLEAEHPLDVRHLVRRGPCDLEDRPYDKPCKDCRYPFCLPAV